MRLGFPAPAHIIHEQAVIASLNDTLFCDARDRLDETETPRLPARQAWSCRALLRA